MLIAGEAHRIGSATGAVWVSATGVIIYGRTKKRERRGTVCKRRSLVLRAIAARERASGCDACPHAGGYRCFLSENSITCPESARVDSGDGGIISRVLFRLFSAGEDVSACTECARSNECFAGR